MVGRFVAGLGVGALSAIVPLYSGEAAPRHLRGTLLSLYQVMIIFGLFVSCQCTLWIRESSINAVADDDSNWRQIS